MLCISKLFFLFRCLLTWLGNFGSGKEIEIYIYVYYRLMFSNNLIRHISSDVLNEW